MEYNLKETIWLVGRTGRVGSALENVLIENASKYKIIATDIEDVDISHIKKLEKFIEGIRPDIIINCSSKRDKIWCEENPDEAFKTNSIGARNLAIASQHIGAHLIHVSTDFVFDGEEEKAYNEFDKLNPKSVYGKTMVYAEQFIKDHCNRFTILRASRLYGKKILKSIITEAKEKGKVSYDVNRSSTPVSTLALAELILKFIGSDEYGTFHVASEDITDNKTFVEEVLKISGQEAELVPITQDEKKINIPDNLQLETLMLKSVGYEYKFKWKDDLRRFMRERKVT